MRRGARRRRLLALLAAVVATAAVAMPLACSSDDDPDSGSASEGGAANGGDRGGDGDEDEAEDGGEVVTEPGPITLAVGEKATIRLESNATTGYQWAPVTEPDPAVATVVSTNYRPSGSDRVGAGGTQDIVVEGVAAGSTTLELGYSRPWEEGTPPAETASFPITVS